MVLSISVCLHTKTRCFSRVCAYFTSSIGLNSKINYLKVTGNDTNKLKINNLKFFQYVRKGSLYKITSFCALQTVIVQSRNSYLHTVIYECSNCTDAVNMNSISETAEALCWLYISCRLYKCI